MIRIIAVSSLLFLSAGLHAQRPPAIELLCQDTLFLQVVEDGAKFLQWRAGSRTSMNSILDATGYTVSQLLELNPILRFRDIEPCDLILSPFEEGMLDTSSYEKEYPVFYRIRQGETVFGIAKRLLQLPVDRIMRMNGLTDSNVRSGQSLLIGHLTTNYRSIAKEVGSDPLRVSDGIDSQFVKLSSNKQYTRQKGVAWWNKSKPDPNLFVLHRKAPINSLIEIKNPMFGRSVWAKVIGTIPVTYPEDISVIVSQGVARSLGAIDGRFYVEISYEMQ